MKKLFNLFALLFIISPVAAQQYCEPPDYYTGPYTGITNVSLGLISKPSSSDDGYSDFTATAGSTDLQQGTEATISIDIYYDRSMLSFFAGNVNVRVWIDWNQNKVFDEPTETALTKIQNCVANVTTKFTAKITVPSNASLGLTRMRIYEDMVETDGHITPNPCGYLNSSNQLGQHGECEDYAVNITSAGNSPTISLDKDNIDFDTSHVGLNKILPFEISNTGTADLIINDISIVNDQEAVFSIDGETSNITITPGSNYTVNVVFNPKSEIAYTGYITLNSNDSKNPEKTLELNGTGYTLKAVIQSSKSELNFGNVTKNQTKNIDFTISNIGNGNLIISNILLEDISESIIQLPSLQFPINIEPSDYHTFSIGFIPDDTINYEGTLKISSNATYPDFSINISGKGIELTDVNENQDGNNYSMEILSNPYENLTRVLLNNKSSQKDNFHIQVLNLNGIILKEINIEVQNKNKTYIELETDELTNGVYFIIAQSLNSILSKSFIKLR